MKRVLLFLLACIPVFLVVSYFVPAVRQREMPVGNTFQNVISSLYQPHNWTKWDPSAKKAWLIDAAACTFSEDTTKQMISITIPGKKITVSRVTFLFYRLDEIQNHDTINCALSIVPYVGNSQPRSEHNARIAYVWNTSLFYKMFPFLEKRSFPEESMSALKSYVEDPAAFYGFPISVKQTSDTLFLTRKALVSKEQLFKKLPVVFDSLEQYAVKNNLEHSGRNVYYSFLPNDSLDILAGINIGKIDYGNMIFQFMQMPVGQFVATAHFEGRFGDRQQAYTALRKYILDHQLIQLGAGFEKYLSPLPVADSSIIKMDLSFPLRN